MQNHTKDTIYIKAKSTFEMGSEPLPYYQWPEFPKLQSRVSPFEAPVV
jgi:hypothetical protein